MNRRGFSLIETIVGVFIVGLIVIVIGNIPNAINLVTSSQSDSVVREIAAKRMEDVRLAGYANLVNGTTVINDSRIASLENASGFTVISNCAVSMCGNAPVKEVKITINWSEKSEPKTYQLVTLVAEDGLK